MSNYNYTRTYQSLQESVRLLENMGLFKNAQKVREIIKDLDKIVNN